MNKKNFFVFLHSFISLYILVWLWPLLLDCRVCVRAMRWMRCVSHSSQIVLLKNFFYSFFEFQAKKRKRVLVPFHIRNSLHTDTYSCPLLYKKYSQFFLRISSTYTIFKLFHVSFKNMPTLYSRMSIFCTSGHFFTHSLLKNFVSSFLTPLYFNVLNLSLSFVYTYSFRFSFKKKI